MNQKINTLLLILTFIVVLINNGKIETTELRTDIIYDELSYLSGRTETQKRELEDLIRNVQSEIRGLENKIDNIQNDIDNL
jgi:peptidoglycan hydrolase CwlO-like protein